MAKTTVEIDDTLSAAWGQVFILDNLLKVTGK